MTEKEAKAIKWLKDVRDHNVINLEFMDLVAQVLIRSIEELQKYREIGTVEKFQEASNIIKEIEEAESRELAETIDEYIEELEKKIEEYKAIGTVEECRAAVEKQKAKKPDYYGDSEDGKILCPNCGEVFWDLEECGLNVCPWCGQAIDWCEE